jgi:hypothetical protein
MDITDGNARSNTPRAAKARIFAETQTRRLLFGKLVFRDIV